MFNILPWYFRWGAVALLFAGAMAFGAFKMHAHDSITIERLKVDHATFVAEVKAKGEIAQREAARQAQLQQESINALRKNLALANSNYDGIAYRLQHSAPKRPDGSTVPTQACGVKGTNGQAGDEFVPIGEYKSLEVRSAYDVQTIILYRQYLNDLVAKGIILEQ